MIFNTVRPDRVKEFEVFLGHLRIALDKATDPLVQAQAKSWRMYRATEAGPNGTVMYVFAFDPATKGADYGLGRILADAYPDTAYLSEIWLLYKNSVTSGGTLLNLVPLTPVVPPTAPTALPPVGPAAGSPAPASPAPADPVR
jgi:hypothetical protein